MVDARRGAHETVLGLADHERVSHPHDAYRLPEDHLRLARVAPGPGEPAGTIGRFHVVESSDAAFGLRDDLLRNDHHVALLELCELGDQHAEVVALLDLGQPLDRDDRDHGRPVTRMPA